MRGNLSLFTRHCQYYDSPHRTKDKKKMSLRRHLSELRLTPSRGAVPLKSTPAFHSADPTLCRPSSVAHSRLATRQKRGKKQFVQSKGWLAANRQVGNTHTNRSTANTVRRRSGPRELLPWASTLEMGVTMAAFVVQQDHVAAHLWYANLFFYIRADRAVSALSNIRLQERILKRELCSSKKLIPVMLGKQPFSVLRRSIQQRLETPPSRSTIIDQIEPTRKTNYEPGRLTRMERSSGAETTGLQS